MCALLGPRCAGGADAVRQLAAPLGKGTFDRLVAFGLVTVLEVEALREAAAQGVMDAEGLQAALDRVNPPPRVSASWSEAVVESSTSREEQGWDWDVGPASSEPSAPPAAGRFAVGERLRRSTVVESYHARDGLLGRDVVVHVRRPDAPISAARFLRAVRRQARLQHPNIEPIYEIDRTPDGRLFFASARMLGTRFDRALINSDGSMKAMILHLEALLDIARALTLAHEHGVIHRDVRPHCVDLGDYGEVWLGGWLRARRRTGVPDTRLDHALSPPSRGLGYLAPERILHGLAGAGVPADVWGLGAILYAVLTRRPPLPRDRDQLQGRLDAGIQPPGERVKLPDVFTSLEALCTYALQVDPARRRLSAAEFATELEDVLDGTRAEERRMERAQDLLDDAMGAAHRFEVDRRRRADAHTRAEPRPEIQNAERALEQSFLRADDAFLRALSTAPTHEPTRFAFCRFLHQALQAVENGRLNLPSAHLLAQARQLDPGAFSEQVGRSARLSVTTQPAGVEVTLHRHLNRAGYRVPGEGRVVGSTPLTLSEVRPGPYVLTLQLPQGHTVTASVSLAPGETCVLDWVLPQRAVEGFVFVVGGGGHVGVDGHLAVRTQSLPLQRFETGGFFLAVAPITVTEWGEFLRDGPPADTDLTPYLPAGTALAQADRLPAVGMTYGQIQDYLLWRSQRDGRRYRLPTEYEWEFAARSASGDAYPWGELADPRNCGHVGSDSEERPSPLLDHVRADQSVFGTAHHAGTVREWTEGGVIIRGGSWRRPFSEAHLCIRALAPTDGCAPDLGFRLASDGPSGQSSTTTAVREWVLPALEPTQALPLVSSVSQMSGEHSGVLGAQPISKPVSDDDALEDLDALLQARSERYAMIEELDRGSMGKIMLAYDRVLTRNVALKVLLDKHLRQHLPRYRFIMEARITGRLQHPLFLPIYDFGTLPTGQRFFSMPVIMGHSLRDVLRARAMGDRRVYAEYGRDRLLTVLRRVCQGVAYAHSRGVVHRDLKPANILMGKSGEVAVVDLGLARQIVLDPSDLRDVQEAGHLARPDGHVTEVGSVIGTPYYMSPEQAMGLPGAVDARSDVYGLGAILYQVLTDRPPFPGKDIGAVLERVREGNPTPPSLVAPDHDISDALDETVLTALQHDPDDRYDDARQLAHRLAMHQERSRAKERDRRQAQHRLDQVDRILTHYEYAHTEHVTLRDARRQRREAGEQSHELDLEMHRVERRRREAAATALRQSRMLALGDRRRLAPRVWALLQAEIEAECGGRLGGSWYLRHLQNQFGPDDMERVGGSTLRITTSELACEVTLHRQAAPVSIEGVERRGLTPFVASGLDQGSWVAMVHRDGRMIRVPFVVHGLRAVTLELQWPPKLPPAFTYVAAGAFLYGGDPTADGGRPPRMAHLSAYAIADHRVSVGEYDRFLQSLGPDERRLRAAKLSFAERPQLGAPVTGVTLADAYAYVRWRVQQDGIPYRLPTSAQWEKAARGVDGRLWPGGIDGTADISPYGLRGFASQGLEWTVTAARELPGVCYVRGCGAGESLHLSPCTARLPWSPHRVSSDLGFRLVIPEEGLGDRSGR